MYPTIHIDLPTYAVLAVLGGLVVALFVYFRIDKFELEFIDFIKMFALSIILGFLGSRAIYILSRLPWLIDNFSVQNIIYLVVGGGLVFYGGLLGVLLGIFVYCTKHKISCKLVYNMIAPAIPLFHAFGRVGCFMSGCCYGLKLKTPLVMFGVIQFDRRPTQLIEVIIEILLFVIIIVLQKKYAGKDFLKIYMISYAIFRFLIEFLRGDDIRGFFFGISTSQVISITILIYYIIASKNKTVENLKNE